ncbi:MAG: alanine racemase [Eubacteriales bacterium]|nr:alanine racemase [Eubacteriales bacterium]
MYKEAKRAAWAEINLSNADHNIKNIRKKVGPDVEITGIIKADGYGHGAVAMAEVLRKNNIRSFGVATLHEAVALRDAGAKEEIVMLGLTPKMYSYTIVDYDITPVVMSYDNASALSDAAQKKGKVISGFIAADTGMGRIGYPVSNPSAGTLSSGELSAGTLSSILDVKKIEALSCFKIKGLFSHFATADAKDKSYAREQEKNYNRFYDALLASGINIPMRTFANSAAIMELPSVWFDSVRPGIILYGCYPSHEVDKSLIDLKPVMSVRANIVRLALMPEGTSVSYGRKFIAKRESLIATIPLGYADGFPRPYSQAGRVLVDGVFAPIAGNICMDQCMIDVTDVPGVKVGDEVTIIGDSGENTILADDIGDATGTINYEIVCAFGQRLPKVYIK